MRLHGLLFGVVSVSWVFSSDFQLCLKYYNSQLNFSGDPTAGRVLLVPIGNNFSSHCVTIGNNCFCILCRVSGVGVL